MKIDVQGAETVKKLAPEAVFIFMVPGSLSDLRHRLSERMTETSPEMEKRLATAEVELARSREFDYRVVNRDGCLHQAITDIDAIITAEKCRVTPRVVELL